MDPGSWFGMAIFRRAKNKGGDWLGLAMRVTLISCSVPSWLFSLAPTLWASEDCPLSVHTCGPFRDDFFKNKNEKHIVMNIFFDTGGGSTGWSREGKTHQKLVSPKTIENHVFSKLVFSDLKTRFVSRRPSRSAEPVTHQQGSTEAAGGA